MSSSCDIRVHFTVARQHYFKCECKCFGALSCFIQKCISLRLFTGKGLLFPKICTFEFLFHRGIPIVNWFFPCRSMWRIDPIKGWFQPHTSIRHWTREWINTEIMQNCFEISLWVNFLQMYFEFMINTVPPASNSIHVREKCSSIIILA